jgi:predicted nucleic acid-binding Zn ribbon protein
MSDDQRTPDPEAGQDTGGVVDATASSGIDLAKAMLAAARAKAPTGSARAAARDKERRRTNRQANLAASGARSGASPDDRDPQLLSDAVQRLVADRGWELSMAVGGVIGRWADVVGPDVASHCAPESFDEAEGVVTVRAESTAWATQVRMLASVLVRRLNEELGDGTVTRVRVLGPAGPSWRKGRYRVPGRGPRDTYG